MPVTLCGQNQALNDLSCWRALPVTRPLRVRARTAPGPARCRGAAPPANFRSGRHIRNGAVRRGAQKRRNCAGAALDPSPSREHGRSTRDGEWAPGDSGNWLPRTFCLTHSTGRPLLRSKARSCGFMPRADEQTAPEAPLITIDRADFRAYRRNNRETIRILSPPEDW